MPCTSRNPNPWEPVVKVPWSARDPKRARLLPRTPGDKDPVPWPGRSWRSGLCWGLLSLAATSALRGQCAMCKAAVTGSADGEALARGLNQGILFLLAVPVVLVGAISLLIWRSCRAPARSPGEDW